MIYTSKSFRLEVKQSGTSYVRTATGEPVLLPLAEDDTSVDASTAEASGFLLISTLANLKKEFTGMLWVQAASLLVIWVIAAILSWRLAMTAFTGGVTWTDYILPCIFVVSAVLYSPQVITPVAHDSVGHWVNLRTGLSNLNGHTVIR